MTGLIGDRCTHSNMFSQVVLMDVLCPTNQEKEYSIASITSIEYKRRQCKLPLFLLPAICILDTGYHMLYTDQIMKLIIVESPTKAKTFNSFLKGKDYHVEATLGHIRDLPEKKIAIDTKENYKPEYVISDKRKKTVSDLRALAKKADSIILATDSDREGEAISYHVAYLLGFIKETWPTSSLQKFDKVQRIVFHEITKSAFEDALKNPQKLNLDLVNSQQSRRILDRLVGYTLSPLLWKKIGKGWLSAGRVQTVALRFIVEREKEIEAFSKEPFYRVFGQFAEKSAKKAETIEAKLISKKDIKYEIKTKISLFDGDYTYTKTTIIDANKAEIEKDIYSDQYTVADVVESITSRNPGAPFTTSTLQQEASRKFGFSSKLTMRLAQNLYEKGCITYHRTDSTSLASKFLDESKAYIVKTYGAHYAVGATRIFKTKSKMAQEAHEAIRPTELVVAESLQKEDLSPSHLKLYSLIFSRAVATQMKEAQIKTVKVTIKGAKGYVFETQYETVAFDGFLRVYPAKEDKVKQMVIPEKGGDIDLKGLNFEASETQAPPRYNEASLIKTLEEGGIGRPSTYAPTISTIQERNYVEKKEGRFFPTLLGQTVCNYLSKAFSTFFAVEFTARMEDELDIIAEGKKDIVTFLDSYYKPFNEILQQEKKSTEHINVQEVTDEICPTCGKNLVFRYSKFGKFYACSGYPECKFTKPFFETIDTPCPKCKGKIIVKFTRNKKKFYGCSNYPKCDFAAWKLHQIPKPQA